MRRVFTFYDVGLRLMGRALTSYWCLTAPGRLSSRALIIFVDSWIRDP
jgi:hypothetical protein